LACLRKERLDAKTIQYEAFILAEIHMAIVPQISNHIHVHTNLLLRSGMGINVGHGQLSFLKTKEDKSKHETYFFGRCGRTVFVESALVARNQPLVHFSYGVIGESNTFMVSEYCLLINLLESTRSSTIQQAGVRMDNASRDLHKPKLSLHCMSLSALKI
jgi:hypothetical protein